MISETTQTWVWGYCALTGAPILDWRDIGFRKGKMVHAAVLSRYNSYGTGVRRARRRASR